MFNVKDNKTHLDAPSHPILTPCNHLVDRAGRQLSGNTIMLKGALVSIISNWDQFAQAISCPVHFDADEEEEFLNAEEQWFTATSLLEHCRSVQVDLGQDGWVRNESYQKVVEINRHLKREWLYKAENNEDLLCVGKYWPLQNHEELH